MVQQPYEFGYQSMIELANYIEGDKSIVPENKLKIIPTKIIDKSNVKEFAASDPRDAEEVAPPLCLAPFSCCRARDSRAAEPICRASLRIGRSTPVANAAPCPDTLLELRSIAKTYPGVDALDGVEPRRSRQVRCWA